MISMKERLFVSTLRLYSVIYTKTKYLDVGICNNFTISQFLCPSRLKSTTSCFRSSLSSFDLRPILKTRLFICKRVADDLKITSHIWEKFKRVNQDNLKLCSSFYYNEKHWWQFQLALPIAAIFLFSRILMRLTPSHTSHAYSSAGPINVIDIWQCLFRSNKF
jgi:hypothetical protein